MTTYMQMWGPSTAYDMQPYLLKIRGFRPQSLCQHQMQQSPALVQTGRCHVPQLQRKDRTCCICKSTSAVEDEQHILLHCPGFADLRSSHSHLFAQPQQSLLRFFQQPPSQMATFVRAALLQYANVLGSNGGAPGPQ